MNQKLKKWEIALALSLCITVFHGVALPETIGCNWWGVVFPDFAEATAPVWNGPGVATGGVELRLRLLDWIGALKN